MRLDHGRGSGRDPAAKVKLGSSVAVFGCGGIGLNAVQGACIVGALAIIAVGGAPRKLAYESEMGATHVVDASQVDPALALTAAGVSAAQGVTERSADGGGAGEGQAIAGRIQALAEGAETGALVEVRFTDSRGRVHGGLSQRAMFAIARRDGRKLPRKLLEQESEYR